MEQGGFGGQYETGMSSRGLPNYGISAGLCPFQVTSGYQSRQLQRLLHFQ